jgi:anti-anti-sigma regulatory factor
MFATRERGAQIRAAIKEAVGRSAPSDDLTLDFTDVEFVGFSGADEVIARVALDMPERRVRVVGASDEILRMMRRSLERRGIRESPETEHESAIILDVAEALRSSSAG